ncbi:fanconi-associated nuclease 1-like protein, partial [Leptotrombidium deliense]
PEEIIIISDDEDISECNSGSAIEEKVPKNCNNSVKSEEIQFPSEENDDREFLDLNNFLQINITCKDNNESSDSQQSTDTTENATDFKLNVFKSMMCDILNDAHYAKLFNDDDWKIIQMFTSLSVSAQRLYVRLYVRKRDWKRNIVYKEISDDLTCFLEELVRSSFLLSVSDLDGLKTALNLLDVSEIKTLSNDLNVTLNERPGKETFINAILNHVKSNQTIESQMGGSNTITFVVLRRIKKKLNNSVFRINDENGRVFDRMALLFFPPEVNDDEIGISFSEKLYTLMNVQRGQITYPSYNINRKTETFETRDDLINYEESCKIEVDILDAKDKRKHEQIASKYLEKVRQYYHRIVTVDALEKVMRIPDFLRRLTAGYILVRCLSHCAAALETLKEYQKAVDLYKILLDQHTYCTDYRGKWFERLVINYETHLKQPKNAVKTVCKALQDDKVRVGSKYSLYRRGIKMGGISLKKFKVIKEYDDLNIPKNQIESTTLRRTVNERKNLFFSRQNDEVTILPVENVALEYYKKAGYVSGIHCESIVYVSLFCLLFWDVIYYSETIVKDAFRSRLQIIPLDLNYDAFFMRRRDLILQRLEKLRSSSVEQICEILEQTWNKNCGCLSLVNWEKCNLEQLKEIIHCTKAGPIIEICKRMAQDYRFCRSGFPDLLVWNAEKGQIMAVEVKGPGDQLSPKQGLWIDYLNKVGLTAEVCHVKAKRT